MSRAEASSECPVCGIDSPHWHHPAIREIVQRIASYSTGAAPHSPFNERWLASSSNRGRVTRLADEIVAIAKGWPDV